VFYRCFSVLIVSLRLAAVMIKVLSYLIFLYNKNIKKINAEQLTHSQQIIVCNLLAVADAIYFFHTLVFVTDKNIQKYCFSIHYFYV